MERVRHRRCIVLRGTPAETAPAAARITAGVSPESVLWMGGGSPADVVTIESRRARALLGRSFDAVVLSLHEGLDAEVLGQSQGFVWGEGALVLRMPPSGSRPGEGQERLAVFPHEASAVGHRFWDRFERCLARGQVEDEPDAPLAPPVHASAGSAEQAAVVTRLVARFAADAPTLTALLADRGRGKSSALGLALAEASRGGALRVALTAPSRASVDEIVRFATDGGAPPPFIPPIELLAAPPACDVLVIDEAAQLPVPLLRQLVAHFPEARIAFATTTRGYEGTGRGFVLRFLAELEDAPRALEVMRLDEPIRWSSGDPVERLVFDALALDATPAELEEVNDDEITHRILDPAALAADEVMLRDFFGILVHAHYRTTPSDLHRMLDAPNVRLHALLFNERVVAASLVALEGELPQATCEALFRGSRRLRGHALPETLVCHSGEVDAGALSFVRSVRIATHPALRRQRLATRLVDHVHESYDPDFFGTMFGATEDLLRFRRSVGYELVRVGASRGVRTGEPAAVMLRPATARAEALMSRLRGVLARDLPVFVRLCRAEGELPLSESLARAFAHGLPDPTPLTDDGVERIAASYAHGPRTYETAVTALEALVEAHPEEVGRLDDAQRSLIDGRIRQRRGWPRVARDAGFETVPAAMRALRRAIGALLDVRERR